MSDFYSLTAALPAGKTLDFASLKGKVVLIVNVASACKTPQYATLQSLYEKYKDQGFVVLGFPSNQFKAQEPGTDEEIATFCERNYGVTFPLASKSDVNGPETNSVYRLLKAAKGVDDISWNFDRFFVDREGKVVEYQDRAHGAEAIEPVLQKLL